MTIMQAPLLKM